jgi:hypothetical protein
MTPWLWLLVPLIVIALWAAFRRKRGRRGGKRQDLGSVSPQWIHESRRNSQRDQWQ